MLGIRCCRLCGARKVARSFGRLGLGEPTEPTFTCWLEGMSSSSSSSKCGVSSLEAMYDHVSPEDYFTLNCMELTWVLFSIFWARRCKVGRLECSSSSATRPSATASSSWNSSALRFLWRRVRILRLSGRILGLNGFGGCRSSLLSTGPGWGCTFRGYRGIKSASL